MKKSIFIRFICVLFFTFSISIVSFAQNGNNDWAGINRYAMTNQTLKAPVKGEKRVVFLGNSITEGWANIHPDFFISNKYIGRGISGQTSYQFLVRFRCDVINLQPSLVIINVGTNDIAENTQPYNEDYTFGNIVSMVELAKANKIKVILTSVLPAEKFGWRANITQVPDKIKTLNQRIATYAKKNKIPYVDYFNSMRDNNDALKKEFSNDGVHPTLDGYYVMEQLIEPVIKRTL